MKWLGLRVQACANERQVISEYLEVIEDWQFLSLEQNQHTADRSRNVSCLSAPLSPLQLPCLRFQRSPSTRRKNSKRGRTSSKFHWNYWLTGIFKQELGILDIFKHNEAWQCKL